MITKEELKEIRDRCDAATEAPWVTNGDGSSYDFNSDEYSQTWVETPKETWRSSLTNMTGTSMCEQMDTAEFIAHARTDVPKLLDQIEKLIHVILKDIHDDELGSEFVLVNILKEENSKLREALEFYAHWEEKTANAWSKTYERTVLSVDYPGPSKAREALKK